MREKVQLLGFSINEHKLGDVIQRSINAITEKNKQIVMACANAHSLMVAKKDQEFTHALQDADYLIADGSGVGLAGRIMNVEYGPRITGFDYFDGILKSLSKSIDGRRGRVFFFGASQNTLDLIKLNMPKYFPEVELCGCYSPPFGEWSSEKNIEMIKIINDAEPDVLWVGMTAPKQEKWVYQNRKELNVSIIGSIGAVFDFFADTVPRAPAFMRRIGCEWLYRFITEPGRTWRRHLISEPLFVFEVLKARFRRKGTSE